MIISIINIDNVIGCFKWVGHPHKMQNTTMAYDILLYFELKRSQQIYPKPSTDHPWSKSNNLPYLLIFAFELPFVLLTKMQYLIENNLVIDATPD